ncbi:urea carboxylase [Spiribacter vilamensis]|uniref:Biotin carboxylase n=1 Tax=Spiribacter vilamensis TaxID=531306 RepID=A0A4V2GJ74_9GAMM|nr:urea carboxylase [Spiribacter vilamensis]RZU99205.1 urea carboxylase [Spiribacter vilamensis]TVO61807.1 urea carboxylase [Spiribacter vilamensis]
MFSKILIANRGAIACRIERTLKRLGITAVAVYSEADRASAHVRDADEAILIGGARASESYLDADRILAVAREHGVDAIHPGYGFLSENAEFAEACERAGIAFIGPTPDQIRRFGLKHTARELAAANEVPLLPGSDLITDVEAAATEADAIGYPVMVKSTAGGGGIGMAVCDDETALRTAHASVERISQNNFANAGLFVERFIRHARHIEVQIFGDGEGTVIALGERDCSLQRRNQKVVEETPAPGIDAETRAALMKAAERLGRSVAYRSAGTVEFILDADTGAFFFLEMNTRLQVEHGVTEAVTGVDLVAWMVEAAAGTLDDLGDRRPGPANGHAIQARVYAEDPGKDFQPATGLITDVIWPEDTRVDTWVEAGTEVTPHYDPLLAKVITHSADREAAREAMGHALASTRIDGVMTNLAYLRAIMTDAVFIDGQATTTRLADFRPREARIDVVSAGTLTTVQDWPGRTGYWDIGVPPSGPMDELSFRLGNRLLGNPDGAAGLEITAQGPTLRFAEATHVVITGAAVPLACDGDPVAAGEVLRIPAGATLAMGSARETGIRSYLLIEGGIDVPLHMGSRATFALGQLGGHGGRALQAGDVLHPLPVAATAESPAGRQLPAGLRANDLMPATDEAWTLRAMSGPQGAPDYFTREFIETFFDTDWTIHYNSSRTGVRLIGPAPQWAREDGGEAGLHPSNIHDNAYAIGSVDFTGDMPVILGPDGPSLGGFVCPATIIDADRWKIGQLRPGDRIRFRVVDRDEAAMADAERTAMITTLQPPTPRHTATLTNPPDPVALHRPDRRHAPRVSYRVAGDRYLLVEYGPMMLDLGLRFRVQALLDWLSQRPVPGIIEMTPGVRSLQIHFDPRQLPADRLMEILEQAERRIEAMADSALPSRIIHLPLAWDDSQTRLATRKYMQSVREDAPWCPDNIEFIRRINGLERREDVKRIVFDASYLVMGLGDVYLSAPLATPVDPRHRLVTTKYNPARTWTPENAVGIGGSYMCIYGMEGPGGYQFVGRTLQIWNRYRTTPEFQQPWLLRFFDQVRFYEVSEEELMEMRAAFPAGGMRLDIEETRFSLADHEAFVAANAESIDTFKARQQGAFEAERQRWIDSGQGDFAASVQAAPTVDTDSLELDDDEYAVEAGVQGSVWAIEARVGERVDADATLLVVESMKMEIPLPSPCQGTVSRVLCEPGTSVAPGQTLVIIRREST